MTRNRRLELAQIHDEFVNKFFVLVALDRLAKEKGVVARLLGKLEFFNPIASVKDRIGVAMIDALEQSGRLTRGRGVLVEPQPESNKPP